ncbi:MAG: F0F1 ATP synthase subunit A [Chloroflexi bacterium]|nr:MAG: F0F1 ATP synthase subunit A [Chloroflexota bacterium]
MSKLLSPKVLVPAAIVIVVLIVQNLLSLPGVILPEISIPAEPVFELFGFAITNTLLSSWLTMLVLILGSWAITRRMKVVPGRWQGLLEMVIEGFWKLVEGAAGPKWTPRFFPIVMTIFLFVLTSNWMGLTPLFGGWGVLHHAEEGGHPVVWTSDTHSLGILVKGEEQEAAAGDAAAEEQGDRYILAPMFRAATTDMNVTLALAVVAVALTQWFGLRSLGLGYLTKFVAVGGIVKAFTRPGLGCGGRIGAFFMGIIDIFIGIVESISELGKVVSFSFRLFGNIFAGEVLLGVMAFLIPYVISLPFFGLELFVGLVQALVFMMLSVAFFVVATSGHGEGH